jgi:hypothetical protein
MQARTTTTTNSGPQEKQQNGKRGHRHIDTNQPAHGKLFSVITGEVIAKVELQGEKVIDELIGPNRGKVRLISRAEGKSTAKEKKNGPRFRAERTATAHEMTTEEARNTKVSITKTERGKYRNPHIIYDMKDGLIDTILEVIPATEQKAEGVKKQEDRHNNHTMTKEKE